MAREAYIAMPTSEVMEQLLIVHQELSKALYQLGQPAVAALRRAGTDTEAGLADASANSPEKSEVVTSEGAPRPETIAGNSGVDAPHISLSDTRASLRLVEAHGNPAALHQALKEIYTRGFCKVKDETVTMEILNQLSFEDLLRIAENYIANFIFASWLRRTA